jgi:pantoate--beta-alanine ligase
VEVVKTREAFRSSATTARGKGLRLGLVPTMGAFHPGHMSLVRAAASQCDVVAVSIFVNPLQFSSATDLARYPANLERDLAMAQGAGVGLVFAPSVEEMYPQGEPETKVQPGRLADGFEGASRPGHFSGVATVVTKLLSLAGPCRAFFGEKDFQQLVVVRHLVADLDIDASISTPRSWPARLFASRTGSPARAVTAGSDPKTGGRRRCCSGRSSRDARLW